MSRRSASFCFFEKLIMLFMVILGDNHEQHAKIGYGSVAVLADGPGNIHVQRFIGASILQAEGVVGAERAATIYSLVASCKLNGLDPFAYFRDVLEKVTTYPTSKIDLLPTNWNKPETASWAGGLPCFSVSGNS